MLSPTLRREFDLSLSFCVFFIDMVFFSAKIQRLVTPIRLQRRRHLRSLKRRKLESQKEQKAEFEYALSFPSMIVNLIQCSVPSSPSVSQRRRPRSPPSKHRTRLLEQGG